MRTTLLLDDEPGGARLDLKDVTIGQVPTRKSEPRASGNCDRWGHPRQECVERNIPSGTAASDFIASQTAGLEERLRKSTARQDKRFADLS